MRSIRSLAAAAAAVLSTIPIANAADLPLAMPMHQVPVDTSGWYLRGDIGMSNQQLKSLTNTDPASGAFSSHGLGFDSAPFFGIGVGYQVNNWLRFDVTTEYRGRANFHGSQSALIGPDLFGNNYSGSKSEWTSLANVYVDLGTWWYVTPFVGAGVGASFNQISDFRDDGVHTSGGVALPNSITYAADNGKWNLAWAVYAGLAYQVTPAFTVELAYRYLSLGSATTGLPNTSFDPTFTAGQFPWTMNDLTSHDVKLGVRWMLDAPQPPPPPPMIRKG